MTRAFSLLLALAVAVILPAPAAARAERRMVITVDDLPAQRAQALSLPRQVEITRGVVAALKKRRVPAVGFVNEDKILSGGAVDPARVRLLERWLDAGLELGNHTFSHPDLHRIPVAEFLEDIRKGEQVTKPLAAARRLPWRYFRHPFLHTGRDLAIRGEVSRFLGDHGYTVAPVTIDNSEWIFARAYDVAIERKDRRLRRRIGDAYLEYMEQMTAYYEGQSRALFGREIPQVLLVHANTLNADRLDALLRRLARRGYRFVPLAEALADPAYASPDTFTGAGGITWLHRWALTRGVDKALYAGEPTTPPWIQEVAGIEE